MVTLLVACSGDDGMNSVDNSERMALRVDAGIEMQAHAVTRAEETRWELDDKIGVYVTNYRSTTLFIDGDGTKGDNMEYSFGDGTNYETWEGGSNIYRLFTPGSKRIYLSSTSVDVYGYYPFSATKKDGKTAVDPTAIEIDVSNQDSQKSIDFMRAKTNDPVNNNVNVIKLLFKHRLVKLVFNLKQGEDLLSEELRHSIIDVFTIAGQSTNATYNIFTDALTITPANKTITPFEVSLPNDGYDFTYEAIVLPSPASDRTVTITFYYPGHVDDKDDKITNKFTISSELEAGFKYVYNVTVNATSITVDTGKFTDQW